MCKLGIAHFLHIRTQQHIANLHSYLFADGTCYLIIVTGQNFSGNTIMFQCFDCIGCRLLWWIKESKITDQHHLAFILYPKSTYWRRIALLCNSKDTKSLIVEFIHCMQDTAAHLIGQRLYPSITFCKGADRKHLLYRTLCHHHFLQDVLQRLCTSLSSYLHERAELKNYLILPW